MFLDSGATLADLSDVLGYATSNLIEHRDALLRYDLIKIVSEGKYILNSQGMDYVDTVAEAFGLDVLKQDVLFSECVHIPSKPLLGAKCFEKWGT